MTEQQEVALIAWLNNMKKWKRREFFGALFTEGFMGLCFGLSSLAVLDGIWGMLSTAIISFLGLFWIGYRSKSIIEALLLVGKIEGEFLGRTPEIPAQIPPNRKIGLKKNEYDGGSNDGEINEMYGSLG